MRKYPVRRHLRIVSICTLLIVMTDAISASNTTSSPLSASDRVAIRATIEKYRSSWLQNDGRGVLDTFTDDAVLLPAHGASPVVGLKAITQYWFPPGPPLAVITRLDITVDEISGDSVIAFVRGSDNVGWSISDDGVVRHHFHPGTYLNVMKKMTDGSWRIQAHMWDDGPETVN